MQSFASKSVDIIMAKEEAAACLIISIILDDEDTKKHLR